MHDWQGCPLSQKASHKPSNAKDQREHGHKVGQYDQHGQKIENMDQAKGYTGEVYATQDEAVDRRYSEGKDLGKRRPSIFGNARANIFGN